MDQLLLLLGRRVRELRKEQKRTAQNVAEAAGLSPRFFAQLEAGHANISIGRLSKLSHALDISLSDLVDFEPEVPRSIALLGLRGAGKSTLGPLLACARGLRFVELDEEIEEKAGLALTEIFILHGERYYRRMESECLNELLDGPEPVVMALSGGVVQNGKAFGRIKRDCVTIWLRAKAQDYMDRVIAQGDYRPVANRSNAMGELQTLVDSRKPFYSEAQITIDTSGLSPEVSLEVLQDALSDLS
ncbi:MAG: shikimate kinase [Myxococcota bacterium]|nr:shikimate kinase [Myxococcota bacterium]